MKKFLTLLFLGCLLILHNADAQDIHFSQFYENAILRNPALTGIFSGDYKVGINYRTQWTDISVPFQTGIISAETRFEVNKEVHDYISIGVCATFDHAGSIDFNTVQVYPAVNYNKSLEDHHNSYFSVGFAGGYTERSVDESKMTFSSQYINGGYNSSNPTGEALSFKKVQNYDLAAGVSLNSSMGENNQVNYYIGAAAYHITKPNESFIDEQDFVDLNTKWEANFGFKYSINQQYALTMHFNYSNQAPYQEWIGGGLLSWRNIGEANPSQNFTLYAGLFYRLNDALIPTIKLDYQVYSFTLSYDINNSGLKPASEGYGGYEMSLYIRGAFKKNKNAADNQQCPHFEDMIPSGFSN